MLPLLPAGQAGEQVPRIARQVPSHKSRWNLDFYSMILGSYIFYPGMVWCPIVDKKFTILSAYDKIDAVEVENP